MKKAMLLFTSAVALSLSCYNFRGFLPCIGSYPQRLQWLSSWPSEGYYAFNCSGLIAYAHGERWSSERDMWANKQHQFQLIQEADNLYAIQPHLMQPGDVIVFGGPDNVGLHVVAYLGDGIAIDSDSRRGWVTKYRLFSKSPHDPWFSGHVRIYRWETPAKVVFNPHFFDQEQQEI